MSAEAVAERWMAEKTALDALLTYANDATSAGDTDIGEAIRTLVDGYGKGGGDIFPFTKVDVPIHEFASYSQLTNFASDFITTYVPSNDAYVVLIDFKNNTKTARAGISAKILMSNRTMITNYSSVSRVGQSVTGATAFSWGIDVYNGATVNLNFYKLF